MNEKMASIAISLVYRWYIIARIILALMITLITANVVYYINHCKCGISFHLASPCIATCSSTTYYFVF